ncbi:MAG: gliding motility-associated C-terminal domain-containing protein [Saprospiraceae bacterium]|nr:gliding motility-associated C-terminal domain-containing protein [Saprospiraceae bacterium]MCF8248556.1 gliding motility-associated C-terminal domain-containing protein [Saprospiraceae bacterium]MCF8280277.1 gliding motility-associated C-terminal domain-containing protein [Bacteroidales bacterium]MCF8310290.1 gliding motility-associated C-terminal domain-containing protein [Saprospiraceae bacterium]MCF8439271.1 gliding motility-associated C-terminal domain-containing protein [Saprospiraceae 
MQRIGRNWKKWRFWATSLLVLTPFLLSAQKIIYVDTAFSIFVPKTIFGEIDINTCTDSLIEEEPLQFSYDVLVNSDGEMYGYGPLNGFIYDTLFFLSLNEPASLYWPPNSTTISHEIRGLTCDENGIVYSAGKGISRRNTNCCYEQNTPCCDKWKDVYLGTLPPGMQCLGDITYRRGKFYLSAIGNKLVEVNMKDPSKSQIVMEFPPGTLPIHGLTTVQVGCDSVITYATGRAWNHSIIYELNFNNWTLTQVCDMPLLAIDGAANQTECMLPPCDLFVDLDNDNSSLAFWGNYCADPFCLPPMTVTDTDVVILSMANTLDSMLLELTGSQNGASEYLETNMSAGNLTILGNGSSSLLFINNGTASLSDFEAALKSVAYQNVAVPLTYGMRHVRVNGWSGGVASIVSTSDLPLTNNVLQTIAVATLPTCHGLQNGSLEVQTTGGTAPYAYQWLTGSIDTLLNGIGAGSYPITVEDAAGCVKSDTFVLVQPDNLEATIAYMGLSTICNSSGALNGNAVGGNLPYTFIWDNGIVGTNNDNLGAGDYLLTVVDSNGCQATAIYSILEGDTILVNQVAAICEGESLAWNGLSLSADTLACMVFAQANGCDSTVCMALTVHPLPLPQITSMGSLCNGQSVSLSVGQFASYLWSSGENLPEILVNMAGDYLVTVTNSFGCTATASTVVMPAVSFEYSFEHPCFGVDDGSIIFGLVNGGTPPFLYSIDSTNFFQSSVFNNLPSGEFWPSVMDATNCKVFDVVVLDAPLAILLDAGADVATQLGVPVTLGATTNLNSPTILWEPADFLDCSTCLNVMANPPFSLEYSVTVSDANGCEAVDTIAIFVSDGRKYYIPTAFSPNDDGTNEGFTIFSEPSAFSIASLEIFDRWGELVFQASDIPTNDTSRGWKGDLDNEPMPTGFYVYVVKLLSIDGEETLVRGEINLVR